MDTTSKAAHTPVPWEVYEGGNFIIIGKYGFKAEAVKTHYLGGDLSIASMRYPIGATLDQHQKISQLAHFIVRACNAHNDMLAALKAMKKAFDQLMPGLANIAVQDYKNINEAPILAPKPSPKRNLPMVNLSSNKSGGLANMCGRRTMKDEPVTFELQNAATSAVNTVTVKCVSCGKDYDPWTLVGVPDWMNYCSKECYQKGTGIAPCPTCNEYDWRCECKQEVN